MNLCECGCGNPAPIAKRTNTRLNHVKGEPVRFICGHHTKGKQMRPLEERFWEKVDKRGPDDCWLWTAAHDQHGYGQIQVGTFTRQERKKAHRLSWEFVNGPIPEGIDICHKCDNPPCVNPSHLFAGTHQDNMDDMIAKGRGSTPPLNHVSGEQNGRSVFTNEDARNFRKEFRECKTSIHKFSTLKGVSYPTMWRILNYVTYQDA